MAAASHLIIIQKLPLMFSYFKKKKRSFIYYTGKVLYWCSKCTFCRLYFHCYVFIFMYTLTCWCIMESWWQLLHMGDNVLLLMDERLLITVWRVHVVPQSDVLTLHFWLFLTVGVNQYSSSQFAKANSFKMWVVFHFILQITFAVRGIKDGPN